MSEDKIVTVGHIDFDMDEIIAKAKQEANTRFERFLTDWYHYSDYCDCEKCCNYQEIKKQSGLEVGTKEKLKKWL